jgi:hypothetical protein
MAGAASLASTAAAVVYYTLILTSVRDFPPESLRKQKEKRRWERNEGGSELIKREKCV